MKSFFAFILSALAVSSAFAHLSYKQTISVDCGSPAAAESLSAEILRFPLDKKIAFSSRWDDTNPRHAATALMLSQHGLKATCYLVGKDFNPQMLKALDTIFECGGSVGSHTISHPFLPSLLPNEIFRQIAIERAWLESALDTNVVAFVLPFTTYKSALDSNVEKYVGYTIFNTGYLSSPEPQVPNKDKYFLPDGCDILSSATFSPDDHNPSEKLFKSRLAASLKKISSGADPHITLGIHSWHSSQGLKDLGGFIDEAKNDSYWYCNENEYAAYRTQFLNSKIEKIGAKGSVAAFVLSRPAATNLGCDIPLSLKFSSVPKSVSVAGAEVSSENGIFNIGHFDKAKSPKKIDYIKFDAADASFKPSPKFAGLAFSFKLEGGGKTLTFSVHNDSSKVENISVRWVLPPCFFAAYAPAIMAKDVAKGKSKAFKANLEKTFGVADVEKMSGKVANSGLMLELAKNYAAWRTAFSDGAMTLVAQCDFLYDGSPARVWVSTSKPQPVRDLDCPRDRAAVSGDYQRDAIDEAGRLALSQKDSVLKGIGGNKWSVRPDKTMREFHVPFNAYPLRVKYKKLDFEYIVACDFVAPRDGEFDLYCLARAVDGLYVNGKKISDVRNITKLALDKGRNRVLLVLATKASKQASPIFSMKDGSNFLPCLTPKF